MDIYNDDARGVIDPLFNLLTIVIISYAFTDSAYSLMMEWKETTTKAR